MSYCTHSPQVQLIRRQNSVGHAVLFNRGNNQIQLSTNAHSLDNGVEHSHTNSGHALCPTCHRPIPEGESAQQHSPAFMDSEYFRLLSSINSDLPSVGEEDVAEEKRPSGSLPRSAFNQGYFEQYVNFILALIKDSLLFNQSWEEEHVVSYSK